jgi:hypothetical protein
MKAPSCGIVPHAFVYTRVHDHIDQATPKIAVVGMIERTL